MKIADKALNYLKSITAQTISNAGSGHTGSSLGMSAIMLALFKDHYVFDISDTDFLNRDRLVLSAGHACPVYYSLLSMFGFDLSIQDLKEYRTLGSKTPGHPEYQKTDGVEVSTGPLGQGVANAVGMAIGESILEERFNSVGFPIIDNYTYCVCSDGDLMEGVAMEACSLAGTLNLKRLILLYDNNDVTIDGNINLANNENIAKKFKAMGWNVIKVRNGNNFKACSNAIARAKKSDKPTIIIFKTMIGIGTEKEGTSSIHGVALSSEELKSFNEKLGVNEKFYIPNDVRDWCMASARRGKLLHEEWSQELAVYSNSNPDLYKQFTQFFDRRKVDIEKLAKNSYKLEGMSGRAFNKDILNEIAEKLLQVVGGSADVTPSVMTNIESSGNYLSGNKRGRNIHFGVREHAMGAICNGIALYEDFLPFCATFLSFSNYMLPAIRMASMMKLNVTYFFTHDSIYVGQDGASHQPIEQIGQLRLIKGLHVFRPASPSELYGAYKLILQGIGPMAIILSRQNLKVLEEASFKDSLMGGYVIKRAKKTPDVVLYASGSEVALALDVAEELGKKYEVSVVSMPCTEIFDEQSEQYKARVLQKEATLRVAIEASNDNIWWKYVGEDGIVIGVEDYMGSGKGEEVYKKAGFNAKEIAKKIVRKMPKGKNK